MCGIIGYIGKKEAQPILMEGLKRMEYRGYDSAGLAIIAQERGVFSLKKSGKLQNLSQELKAHVVQGTAGIGHIRWATHGVPNDINAHPHSDCKEEIFIIHNGIIENFSQLKQKLQKDKHQFVTATDTEVLAHLIESYYEKDTLLEDAVSQALKEVVGTYGIAVLSSREPQKIVAARLGSPLIVGIIAQGEYMVASDVTAILPQTREVVYLEEGEIVTVTRAGYSIKTLNNQAIDRKTSRVDWDAEQAEKKGFAHFMLKEIMEQP